MKTFMLLTAIPGSGKSTWARQYAEANPGTKIVSSDALREELGTAINDFSHEKEVWDLFMRRIHEYGKEDGATVIADATMISNDLRRMYAESTPEFDRHILVYFDIPYDVCRFQNKLRSPNGIVPDYAMEKMHSDFEEPSEEVLSLYDEMITITSKFVSPQYRSASGR